MDLGNIEINARHDLTPQEVDACWIKAMTSATLRSSTTWSRFVDAP